MKRGAAEGWLTRSPADSPMPSTFVKPTAPLRFCWVRAARSPCLPMVSGWWRNRLVLPRNYDSFQQAWEKPGCSPMTPSTIRGRSGLPTGSKFSFPEMSLLAVCACIRSILFLEHPNLSHRKVLLAQPSRFLLIPSSWLLLGLTRRDTYTLLMGAHQEPSRDSSTASSP